MVLKLAHEHPCLLHASILHCGEHINDKDILMHPHKMLAMVRGPLRQPLIVGGLSSSQALVKLSEGISRLTL